MRLICPTCQMDSHPPLLLVLDHAVEVIAFMRPWLSARIAREIRSA